MAPAIEHVLTFIDQDFKITLTTNPMDLENENESNEKESDEKEEKEEKEKYEQRLLAHNNRGASVYLETHIRLACEYLQMLYQQTHISIPTPPPRLV